jgi:hypothetical protein
MDPGNPASDYSRYFSIFKKNECPEDWIELMNCLLIAIDEACWQIQDNLDFSEAKSLALF